MDYEKAYKAVLKTATQWIKDGCTDKERICLESVFPELKESGDERMIKAIEYILYENYSDAAVIEGVEIAEIVTWLEELKEPIDPFDTKLFQDGVKEGRRLEREDIKKEPIPIPDKFSGLQSLLLQYLRSAANRTDDAEIESDTDLWGRKILDYVWKYSEKQKEQQPAEYLDLDNASQDYVYNHFCQGADFTPDYIKGLMEDAFIDGANWQKEQEHPCDSAQFEEGFKTGYELGLRKKKEQKPAEWSKEDEKNRRNLMSLLANMRGDRITEETYQKYYPWLKDLRPSWKPSEEQIKALYCALNDAISLYSDKVSPLYEEISRTHFDALESLYNDLKKLM